MKQSDELYDHARTSDKYADHARHSPYGEFLGETEDFWRGAASTYRLIAAALLAEEEVNA